MIRNQYANPPVHEVILDVQFREALNDDALQAIPKRLGQTFGNPTRLSALDLRAELGPSGTEVFSAESRFAGWAFEEIEPRWVLRTTRTGFTVNAARSADWPRGPYVGWEVIFARFEKILSSVHDVYSKLSPRRAGLRYLNRIAVPFDSDIEHWFAFGVTAPSLLAQPHAFHIRQTWAEVRGFPGISATIALAKVMIPDAQIAASNYGVLLDIDVFNLRPDEAPAFAELPAWFEQAHEVENALFEECITNALRERFA